MLTELTIRDFAIIADLSVEFGPGMTVLTGETGAGKSILIDALQLTLGARADTTQVRNGAERADITARFESRNGVADWLAEHELDEDSEVLLRRTVSADGRSRAYINGRPVAAAKLRELGSRLIEIHGQHEHYALLSSGEQRRVLDQFAAHGQLVADVQKAARAVAQAEAELESLRAAGTLSSAEAELLRFQLDELEAIQGDCEALESLHETQRQLAATQDSMAAMALASELLDSDADKALSAAANALRDAARKDGRLRAAAELAEAAQVQAQEAARELAAIEFAEDHQQQLAEVESRLQRVHDLARKHRVDAADLLAHTESLQQRLEAGEQAESRLEALQEQLSASQEAYHKAADALTQSRKAAAERLADEVSRGIQQLGMPSARFSVAVSSLESAGHAPHGQDRIEFMVATNPGSRPGPMSRIASGGELARIGLAIKVATMGENARASMIFDEVDAGIGGPTAQIVGEQLRALAADSQVLCVTHLAQVAANAHHHLRVEKRASGETVHTRVQTLAEQDRVEELARMIGGAEVTERSLAHASEMLSKAS